MGNPGGGGPGTIMTLGMGVSALVRVSFVRGGREGGAPKGEGMGPEGAWNCEGGADDEDDEEDGATEVVGAAGNT